MARKPIYTEAEDLAYQAQRAANHAKVMATKKDFLSATVKDARRAAVTAERLAQAAAQAKAEERDAKANAKAKAKADREYARKAQTTGVEVAF
jgi:hypothetical protein